MDNPQNTWNQLQQVPTQLSSPQGAAPSLPGTSEKSLKSLFPPHFLLEENLDYLPRAPRSFKRCFLQFGIFFFFPQLLAELFQQQGWIKKGESRESQAGFSATVSRVWGSNNSVHLSLVRIPWGSSWDRWHCSGYQSTLAQLHGKLPVLFPAGFIP